MSTILIVDDEKSLQYSLKRMFDNEYRVLTADDGCTALDIFKLPGSNVDVVFLDVRMPGMGGIEVLKKIREISRNTPVVVMTAFGDSDTAIQAMKEGAFDYLLKPFEYEHIKEIIEKAVKSARLQNEAFICSETEELSEEVEVIVGNSQAILDVCKMVGQASSSDIPVLLMGESGVGKEIVARAIYNHSNRKGRTFMAVNCAAIAEGVVESELFGFEKGAFTGAEKRRIGRFEQCDGGTIFLDEIGDMNPATQAKLLRVLQDGKFERIGSNETINTDVRVIAASNKNLNDEVKQNNFREDLFHRLNVFSIYIHPLRERKEDIPILSEYFISRSARETEKQIRGISPEAMELFKSYDWPGNVRELENALRRAAVVTTGDIIDIKDISLNPEPYKRDIPELADVIEDVFNRAVSSKSKEGIFRHIVSSAEKAVIEKALKMTKGNQVQASDLLGITRVTLRKKIQEYNITD